MSDFGFGKQGPKRTEKFTIKMDLDATTAQDQIEYLQKLCINQIFPEHNCVHLTYKFFAEYFGDTAEKLTAIHKLLKNPNVKIVLASCETLEKGNCLVYEVFKALEKVIRVLKDRTDETC